MIIRLWAMSKTPTPVLPYSKFKVDVTLIVFTGILAGCGLIYEYLLSHYAARVLGAVETVIFTIISLMIVSMGVGSFLSSRVKDAFYGFVILELSMALAGSMAVLVSGGLMAGLCPAATAGRHLKFAWRVAGRGGHFYRPG